MGIFVDQSSFKRTYSFQNNKEIASTKTLNTMHISPIESRSDKMCLRHVIGQSKMRSTQAANECLPAHAGTRNSFPVLLTLFFPPSSVRIWIQRFKSAVSTSRVHVSKITSLHEPWLTRLSFQHPTLRVNRPRELLSPSQGITPWTPRAAKWAIKILSDRFLGSETHMFARLHRAQHYLTLHIT